MHIVFRIFLLIFCTSIAYCSFPQHSFVLIHTRVENQFGYPIEGKVSATLMDEANAKIATLTGRGSLIEAAGTSDRSRNRVPFETLKNAKSAIVRTSADCESERTSVWFKKRYVGLVLPSHPREGMGSRAYWRYEYVQTVKLDCKRAS